MSVMAFLEPRQLVNSLFSFSGLSRGPLYHYKCMPLPDHLSLFSLRTSVPLLNRGLPAIPACPQSAGRCCSGTSLLHLSPSFCETQRLDSQLSPV